MNTMEYLPYNKLDREFQAILYPLNLLQSVFIQPKYRISQGVISPNGYFGQFQCVLGFIFVQAVLFHKAYIVYFYFDIDRNWIPFIAPMIYYSASCLFMLAVITIQSKNTVQFILKMDRVYRSLDKKDDLKKLRNGNWTTAGLICLGVLTYIVANYLCSLLDLSQILYTLSLFYFKVPIIFYIQTVKFLTNETKLWMKEQECFLVKCCKPNHSELIKYLREVEREETRLFKAYKSIIDAYAIYKRISHQLILLLTIEIFFQPLMYIGTSLMEIRTVGVFNGTMTGDFLYGLFSGSWFMGNFILLICFCVACQQLYLTFVEVDKASAVICGQYESICVSNIHKLCKNVARLNECARAGHGLSSYGALAVDAALPLRLLALVATYTVVLLQFALLP